MSEIFAVIGNLLMIGVVVTYFNQVREGASVPNPSTWLLWALVTVINAVTYFYVVEGNLWQSAYTLIVAVGLSGLFLYSLIYGKFGKVGWIEVVCFLLAGGVIILWRVTGNATVANLSLQVIFIISFIPTIVGLLRGSLREKAFAWNLAVTSYIFTTVSLVSSADFLWASLAFPIVNGILGNGSVAVIIQLQTRGFLVPKPSDVR